MNKGQKGAAAVALVAFLLSLRKGPGKLVRDPIDPGSLKGLYFGNMVSDEFAQELLAVSKRLGFDPNDLMTVFRIERGKNQATGKLGPGVYHKYTDKDGVKHEGNFSYGLLGISPNTAVLLGTTPEAIYLMSDVEQLALVEKYFKKHGWDQGGAHPIAVFDDIYSAVWGGQVMIDAGLYDPLIKQSKQPELYEEWRKLAGKSEDWAQKGYITKKDVLGVARSIYRSGKKNAR